MPSDLSALALPDSPELPTEIKEAIRQLEYAAISFGESPDGPTYAPTEKLLEVALASLRSVIAKHLPREGLGQPPLFGKCDECEANISIYSTIGGYLKAYDEDAGDLVRHICLSGSSRGEE